MKFRSEFMKTNRKLIFNYTRQLKLAFHSLKRNEMLVSHESGIMSDKREKTLKFIVLLGRVALLVQ